MIKVHTLEEVCTSFDQHVYNDLISKFEDTFISNVEQVHATRFHLAGVLRWYGDSEYAPKVALPEDKPIVCKIGGITWHVAPTDDPKIVMKSSVRWAFCELLSAVENTNRNVAQLRIDDAALNDLILGGRDELGDLDLLEKLKQIQAEPDAAKCAELVPKLFGVPAVWHAEKLEAVPEGGD